MRLTPVSGLLALLLGLSSAASFAQGRLTLYCSSDAAWCQQAKTEFEKKTGIQVDMTRKSSGETYAQLKAESSNPKGDIWWGGTGDPHLQAAEEGLTEAYASPRRNELHDWANSQAVASKVRTVGIYSGALGFGYNTDLLKKQGLPEPKCWKDLIKPVYKGKIQVANPNASGTAYTLLATMVQGVDGALVGFATFIPALISDLWEAVKAGDLKRAMQIQDVITPLKDAVYGGGEPTGEAHARMKAGMYLAGVIDAPTVRPPTEAPTETEMQALRAAVANAGLLKR